MSPQLHRTSAAIAAAILLASTSTALAAANRDTDSTLTFHRDVEPLLQRHCQECHRPGGPEISGMIAPMSLVDYTEVRPWARSIARAVEAREMPPWGATHETSAGIANSRSLAPEDIDTIVRWGRRRRPGGRSRRRSTRACLPGLRLADRRAGSRPHHARAAHRRGRRRRLAALRLFPDHRGAAPRAALDQGGGVQAELRHHPPPHRHHCAAARRERRGARAVLPRRHRHRQRAA